MPPFPNIQQQRNLFLRDQIIRAIRRFFHSKGYLEVETPIRIPAPAPEAHIEPLSSEGWWLHTSPELCMKRLLASGLDRIFQICRCFRQGERGVRHLSEFTLLEWYTAGHDYLDMMAQTEALVRAVANRVGDGSPIRYQGRTITLSEPFRRMTVAEAFDRYAPGSVKQALAEGRFDEWLALEIEPRLPADRPLFLVDYPAACGALARLREDEPDIAERFELYLGGLELCNGFSELTDAKEQRRRFEVELDARGGGGTKKPPMPEPFLKALDAMPAAAGNALGVDRLVMVFADAVAVDEVVAFAPEDL
ncbi:MAG: EF-P lysine aminoacylase EpmA [Desulfobacterales bacterium]